MDTTIKSDQLLIELGNSVRKVRLSKNLSIVEVSAKAGIESNNWTRLEKGGTNPTWKTICKVALALEVEPFELLSTFQLLDRDNQKSD